MALSQIGTKEYAEEMLKTWLEAQESLATGKSYKIGSRELTRADTDEIMKWINYWQDQIQKFESGTKKRQKVKIGVPRDL